MSFITSLITWTQNTFTPLGPIGLFILAFMEASFFPVPPDILLVVLTLAEPDKAFLFALICTLGSVLGALLGYLIGYIGKIAILKKFVSENKIDRVHNLFNKYGPWGVFIAAFTPIPFKIITIAAGVFYINIKKFILASLIGRGLRFFIIALLVMLFGEMIVNFIDTYFGLLTLLVVAILTIVFILYRKSKKI